MLYRKKPVIIEAKELGLDDARDDEIMCWCGGQPLPVELTQHKDALFVIPTLEGDLVAMRGDWIIQGVKGEYYPCKPDVFAITYELA